MDQSGIKRESITLGSVSPLLIRGAVSCVTVFKSRLSKVMVTSQTGGLRVPTLSV
jgi:hypothetical protein